jgi:hypothetical protein
MSRRNFTLLIIILVIIAIVIFIFLYFFKGPSTPDDGTGTNFFAGWGPFKKKVPAPEAPEVEEPPVEIPQEGGEVPIKLHKISTMPIAGYGIFTKERFKDIPVVTPPTPTPEGVEVPTENTVPETASIKTPVKKPTPPPTEFMTALRYVAKATGNIKPSQIK